MSVFSEAELAYLAERRLGRLATVDPTGLPHVVPIGMWRYNAELDTIDIGGRDFARTSKFRNVQVNPTAAFVVDDILSTSPWHPRALQVRGRAEALDAVTPPGGGPAAPIIRIAPTKVVSWGLEHQEG